MEEQKIDSQNNNKLNALDMLSSNNTKIIYIILPIIILIGIITIFYFTNQDNPIKINIWEEKNKPAQDIVEIEKCLEEENSETNCNLIFSSPGIEQKCEEMTNLKNECFYKIAMINSRLDLCWKIEDSNLKEECEIEVNNVPLDIPMENDPIIE